MAFSWPSSKLVGLKDKAAFFNAQSERGGDGRRNGGKGSGACGGDRV